MSNKEAVLRPSTVKPLLLEGVFLLLLLVGGSILRFADSFQTIWTHGTDKSFFLLAQVTENGLAYANPHVASKLYVFLLNVVCLLFGNVYEACAFAQFVLFLLAVSVWYFLIRKVVSPIAALIFATGAMLLPDVIALSVSCNPIVLVFLLFGITAWTLVSYANSEREGVVFYFQLLLAVIFTAMAVISDISGILYIVAFVFVYLYRYKKTNTIDNIVSAILAIVIFSYILFTNIYVHMVLDTISPDNPMYFNSFYHLKPVVPTVETLKAFVVSFAAQPILIIFAFMIFRYWFIKNKSIVTWLLLETIYVFLLKIFSLDTYLSHDFLIYMLLLMSAGIGVYNLLLMISTKTVLISPKVSDTEPRVTVIEFEKEEAVVVSALETPQPVIHAEESERPLIFIPKTFETPKRISKPKIDFEMEVEEDKNCYDVEVSEQADFDIL